MATPGLKAKKAAQQLKDLQKLDDNKNCADCGARGPLYVVCSLHTFICTNCAGVHQKFGHRVKSVNMATFTPEEVDKLAEEGNKVIRKLVPF